MGIGVAENGDVWIADGSDNQLLFFPEGRIKDGKIVKVAGLKSPFDIVIDPQNRVWVSNSQSDTVVRFPADDPTKVESFRAGISVRALAMDSKANVWVVSNMSLDFPVPKMPDGASIMVQFADPRESAADLSEANRRGQSHPPRRDPGRADGLRRRRGDRLAVGSQHRRQRRRLGRKSRAGRSAAASC